MKVLLAGKNKVAIEICEYLRTDKTLQILNVVAESSDTKTENAFTTYCKKNNLDLAYTQNKKDLLKTVEAFRPDLLISAQYAVIISKEIIKILNGNVINIHNSPLPYYRGMAPISLAILHGKRYHGVTLHVIDDGIDTGRIIDRAFFKIVDKTNFDVYNLCTGHGIELFKKNFPRIKSLLVEKTSLDHISSPQNQKLATYFPLGAFNYQNTTVDFNKSANQVICHLRAYTSPPLLFPTFFIEGVEKKIVSWENTDISTTTNKPSEVIETTATTALVATRDYAVKLKYL